MISGFISDTKLFINNNGLTKVRFSDLENNEEIEVLDKMGTSVNGIVRKEKRISSLYKFIISNKVFLLKDNSFYDITGQRYTFLGEKYGSLIDSESTLEYRKYVGVGHAELYDVNKGKEIISENGYRRVLETKQAYIFYDSNGTIKGNNLTLREADELAIREGKIPIITLNEYYKNGYVSLEGNEYEIIGTDSNLWYLYDGNKSNYLIGNERLFSRNVYNETNPKISGFKNYVSQIIYHGYENTEICNIETEGNSYQLDNNISVGILNLNN